MNDIEKVWLKAYCAAIDQGEDTAKHQAKQAVNHFKEFRKSMGWDEETKERIAKEKEAERQKRRPKLTFLIKYLANLKPRHRLPKP